MQQIQTGRRTAILRSADFQSAVGRLQNGRKKLKEAPKSEFSARSLRFFAFFAAIEGLCNRLLYRRIAFARAGQWAQTFNFRSRCGSHIRDTAD
jgi:hypothetical protein